MTVTHVVSVIKGLLYEFKKTKTKKHTNKGRVSSKKHWIPLLLSGPLLTIRDMQQSLSRWDSPRYGVLLPADKRAPQGAFVELGGAGALPGADAGTTAGSLPVWDFWKTHTHTDITEKSEWY